MSARRARSGFTLIEVLMAAFVLALGVLGLAALFAGAARQQQIASETTQSVSLSKGAEATIRQNFGRLSSDCNDDLGFGSKEWIALRSEQDLHYLTISSGTYDGSAYFAAKPTQQLPRVCYEAAEPAASPMQEHFYVGDIGFRLRNFDGVFDGRVESLGERRIIGRTLDVRVTIARYPCDGSGQRPLANKETRVFDASNGLAYNDNDNDCDANLCFFGIEGGTFMRVDTERVPIDGTELASFIAINIEEVSEEEDLRLADDGMGGYFPACNGEATFVESASGQELFSDGPLDLLEVPSVYQPAERGYYTLNGNNVILNPPRPIGQDAAARMFVEVTPGTGTLSRSGTTSAGIFVEPAKTTSWFIERVEVVDYEWRADRLVSLEDRYVYQDDPTRESGRVPVLGYTALYRSLGPSEPAQFAVFTYAIRPGAARSEFIPPETDVDYRNLPGTGVLRSDPAFIGYDEIEQAYYAEPTSDDPEWHQWTAPGQILLFGGEAISSIDGADTPVRVVRRQYFGPRPRAYLDRAPRSGGAVIVDPFRRRSVNVWYVQPQVRSQADGSSWGLRPIEARVFQVDVQ
ncbi:MAG: prepilin-type N-terminal cleavage/methylation domain-containing protein [Pseudomonadota bacterium]